MELTYTKVGDYYIPDLALDDGDEYEIGVYGQTRKAVLGRASLRHVYRYDSRWKALETPC